MTLFWHTPHAGTHLAATHSSFTAVSRIQCTAPPHRAGNPQDAQVMRKRTNTLVIIDEATTVS